jgi:hypothetical protein
MSDIRLYRNVAGQRFFIELLTAAGVAITTGVVTGLVAKDAAAQGALAGTVTHVGGGQYRVDLAQADTNATTLGFLFTHATAVPVSFSATTEASTAAATALAGTWTYDPALLQDSTVGMRNQVRLLIQDTQASRPLVLDAEIDWLLATEANAYMAAAMACETLVGRAGGVKSKWVSDLRIVYDVSFYRGLAANLRARGAGHQIPFAGGISISDKQIQEQDADAVQPRAFRTEMDNPRAEQPSPGSRQDGPFHQVP